MNCAERANGEEMEFPRFGGHLRADSTAFSPVFPILITIQPDDYLALAETMIDEVMLAEAHTLAGEFLRDAGL